MKKGIYCVLIAAISLLCACGATDVKTEEEETKKEEEVVEEVPVGEADAVTDIKDFSASLLSASNDDVNSDTAIDFDQAQSAYKLDFNHQNDIYEINFYRVSGGEYDMSAREYVATYYNYYPMDQAYIKYDIPQNEPNMVVSFVTKGRQMFDYYIEAKTGELVFIGESDNDNSVQYIE